MRLLLFIFHIFIAFVYAYFFPTSFHDEVMLFYRFSAPKAIDFYKYKIYILCDGFGPENVRETGVSGRKLQIERQTRG